MADRSAGAGREAGGSPRPAGADVRAFRALVRVRGRELYREMPWRGIDDPYAVLVSEVMLQQTQVARVLERYPRWLDAFPTVDALAAAPLEAVLDLWQGLGYNRRALALKRTADLVTEHHAGVLPPDEAVLRSLPGIGPATAAAILDYAFRIPAPFIETNVRAVFLHHFFADAADVPDRELMPLVEEAWDRRDPRAWGYALMDYGSRLKQTVPNPSRASRHHVRQSRFEGSRRQKRARLLRAVLGAPGLPSEAYAAEAGIDPATAAALLDELACEGFLSRHADGWRVAD